MTVVSYIAKFSWTSLLLLVWLRAFGYMADNPGLTWGAFIIFGAAAVFTSFLYIGMENVLWKRMYPQESKTENSENES